MVEAHAHDIHDSREGANEEECMRIAGDESVVPLSDAALELGMTRERVMRRVQSGQLEGGKIYGHWVVSRAAIERARAEAAQASTGEVR
jgi:hypothetical protein